MTGAPVVRRAGKGGGMEGSTWQGSRCTSECSQDLGLSPRAAGSHGCDVARSAVSLPLLAVRGAWMGGGCSGCRVSTWQLLLPC